MKARIEMVGNRIHLESKLEQGEKFDWMVATCKAVPGASWSKANRKWTYPLDLETCRLLRETWGDKLIIGPELWEWAKAARERESLLAAHNNVNDMNVMAEVVLDRVKSECPGMWEAMTNRPYQPVAAKYMAMARQCLNADQPGIGKTIETLGALVEADVRGPVLVLAPRTSVRSVWEPEINGWLETLTYPYTIHVALGTPKAVDKTYAEFERTVAEEPDGLHFLLANAEQARIVKSTECPSGTCDGDEDWCPDKDEHKNKSTVRKPFLHRVEWSAIIADETHRWLINTRGKKASQVGYGFTKLRTNEQDVRYALTGTPLKGKKHNLFGTLNWLKPKTYTSKWRWVETYFDVFDNGYAKVIGDMRGEAKESFFRSLGGVMIRRTKDELRAINPAWMPPEKRYHDVWVDMSSKQAKVYKQMEDRARAELDGGALEAQGILAELTRLKQFANSHYTIDDGRLMPTSESAKLSWLFEFLSERGIEQELSEDVRKVVVASQFTSLLNVWAGQLRGKGIEVVMITGETKKPEESARLFQNDDSIRVCLINTEAGGVSITLDRADDMVIMDETWVPDQQEQVEDRIHRASNVTHQVDIWYVRSRGTIEEDIAGVNSHKASSNHVVLDAQRGLKFAAERFGGVKAKANMKEK